MFTHVRDAIEYLFLEISVGNKQKLLLDCVYGPNYYFNFEPFISIQYDDIVIGGDFNNSLLFVNPLIRPMLSLHLHPVNVSIPTHFHSTSVA